MIALACDHGGYALMQDVKKYLDETGVDYKDFGTYSTESCDYPVYGEAAARAVVSGECERGIIICGTGIGISIAANKVKGARAALCSRLFFSRNGPPAQQCQLAGHGRPRAWNGTGSENCRNVSELRF